MDWDEAREKHKKLVDEWSKIREKLEPIERKCMAKEVGPGGEVSSMPDICISDEYWDLVEKQRETEDKIRDLMREYQKS